MYKLHNKLLLMTLALIIIIAQVRAENEYWKDRLIVKVAVPAGAINISQNSGNCRCGIAKIDGLCGRFGVNRIENFFPYHLTELEKRKNDLSRILVLYLPPEADVKQAVEEFGQLTEVEYAELSFVRKFYYHPNDPLFSSQWGLGINITQAELAYDFCRGDSTISISIVDSGIDMDHPDLATNLWVNPGEDLNGNGIVDLLDWNGVDDDGNGMIDDFWGWDFIDGDNYPNDEIPAYMGGGHGTHCAGIASAQTDNGIGVASLGFNCSLITVRAGAGMVVQYAYEGVAYAISVYADVMSLSWGGGGYVQAEQALFNLAYDRGIVVFAAAGNENTSMLSYPAAYNHVMAVAATDPNDVRCSFSNFGSWVDICAPGSNILSTFLSANYAYMSGTSMSCPFAAGLAGLVKSAAPGLTPDQICSIMMSTADDISAQNPSYVGLLGSGRINAYQAIGVTQYPSLSLTGVAVTDIGNGNGRVDPGEAAEVVVTLQNQSGWQTATGITAYITCNDPGINITQNSAIFPNIPGGNSGSNQDQPFEFSVAPEFTPGYATFYFSLMCQPNNYALSDSFDIIIGVPEILLVDDDGDTTFETYYITPLQELGLSYEYWDNSLNYLTVPGVYSYDKIIWFTGNVQDYNLDSYEQAILGLYLDQGGNLILSGQYIGDEISTSTFYSNYLHAQFNNPNTGIPVLNGIEGDPVSSGTSLLLVGTQGAGNGTLSPSGITPIEPALPIFTYQNSAEIGGLRYENPLTQSRLIYMEFAFEAASGMGGTTSRTTMLNSMLNWIEGGAGSVGNPEASVCTEFKLLQNYPNPFNSSTTIPFTLDQALPIKLVVYNQLGQEVQSVVTGHWSLGKHSVIWNAEGLGSGVYFISLESQQAKQTKKMMIVK